LSPKEVEIDLIGLKDLPLRLEENTGEVEGKILVGCRNRRNVDTNCRP
jgi:hypothetical protein